MSQSSTAACKQQENSVDQVWETPTSTAGVTRLFATFPAFTTTIFTASRTVNGLLKTALGPPPGSITTLSPVHDLTFQLESVNCLVIMIKSMGLWMDQQLRIGDFGVRNTSDNYSTIESYTSLGGDEGSLPDFELNQEAISEHSNTTTLEQRRAYELELQEMEEILELLKSTWRIMGITETIHHTCYAWVQFRQVSKDPEL